MVRAVEREITRHLRTAAVVCYLDHITHRRGNSANQGGHGDKVAAGLYGTRNQNWFPFSRDLLIN